MNAPGRTGTCKLEPAGDSWPRAESAAGKIPVMPELGRAPPYAETHTEDAQQKNCMREIRAYDFMKGIRLSPS